MEIQKPELTARFSLPWLTVVMTAVAIGEWVTPGAKTLFLYDRTLILGGQWWRLWSGHLAHHSFSHLFWNLVVFVPVGVWLETSFPRWTRLFLVLAPVVISALLLGFDPGLQLYAGISGVAVGALTLLALFELYRKPSRQPWFWGLVLLIIVVKIAAEFGVRGLTLFVSFPADFRNVPLSHLGGAVCAVGIFAGMAFSDRTNKKSRTPRRGLGEI